MTTKEITALRKSGKLAEALQAAETEFSKNANIYTVGALFWCLNALYRTQNHDEALLTINRMKSLYEAYSVGDELMIKALAAAERSIMPHYHEIKQAVEQVKSDGGDADTLYRRFLGLYESNELDPSLYAELGWLIYYALKYTSLADARTRKEMLNDYLKLGLSKQSILHSLILSEAVKVEQNTPLQFRIRDFMSLWGFENLRKEDWEQFKSDNGNVLPSLVEKLIGVYAKELKTDNVAASEDFSNLVDRALDAYPNNQNMPYFKAMVLISQGKKEEAISYFRDLILRFPSKYYLWDKTANLVDDPDTRIGLLSKALTTCDDEKFIGGVRLAMAKALIEKNEMSHAKYELNRYAEFYRSQGWNLKGEYWDIQNRLNGVESAADNNSIYSTYSQKAEEFIYSQLPEEVAVKVSDRLVDDRNHPGRKYPLWILRTRDGVMRLKKPTKFGLDRRQKDGTPFSVRIHENKIVWIQNMDAVPSTDWLKEASGELKIRTDRKGKRFAIIGGAYVGEKLLESLVDGQSVSILCIKQDDGRWSAVSLKTISR